MSDKHPHRSIDEFLKYMKGTGSGKERHSFERELERDPFAREALEGLRQLSATEAEEDLLALHDRLRRRTNRKKRIVWYSMAAAVASILIVGTLFLQLYDFTPAEPEKRELLEEAPPGEVPQKSDRQPAAPSPDEPSDEPSDEPVKETVPADQNAPVAADQNAPVAADQEMDAAKPAEKGIRAVEALPEPPEQQFAEKERPEQEINAAESAEKGIRAVEALPEPPEQQIAEKERPEQEIAVAAPAARAPTVVRQIPSPTDAKKAPVKTNAYEMVVVEADQVAGEEGFLAVPNEKETSQLSGTVRSALNQEPLPGASLTLEGQKSVSITDMEGRFSIPVAGEYPPTLIASYAGMETREFALSSDKVIELTLQPETPEQVRGKEKPAARVAQSDALQQSRVSPRSPEPDGGYIQFYKYIQENAIYPSVEKGPEEALVILTFTVTATGEIREVKPLGSPGAPFTKEAVRLLQDGPGWNPAADTDGPVEREVSLRIAIKK